MKKQEMPPGSSEEQIKALADYYDAQSDEDAALEFEAALDAADSRLVQVPNELVPAVLALIEHYESLREALTTA